MISGADLQGGGGSLDPSYITRQDDQIPHLKPTAVTNLTAGSIGVGSGGIMCFGNITAASGLEATTINVAGVGTINTLNVTNSVTCKTVVVNGGDDSQIDFSTADGATSPGATLYNGPYSNHVVVRLNGVTQRDVTPTLITLNGNVLCGVVTT